MYLKRVQVKNAFSVIKDKWSNIDFVLHSIAFSNKDELKGKYLDTSRNNFVDTMLISCFSFTEVANEASKIMNSGAQCLLLHMTAPKNI